ncbi:MAG: mechanosensitive ion channel [Phycisphaerales bacterium]|nr:mechanosensitive ion channel [Planctomycetota bacterium]
MAPESLPQSPVQSTPGGWFGRGTLGGIRIDWDLVSLWGLKIGFVVLLLIGSWLLSGWIRGALKRGTHRAHLDPTLSAFLANLAKWAILTFAVITCLEVFNIQPASFAAVLAALGLAIGLAFQGTLANIASGILLLIFRPFKVGDSVVIAGQAGTVNEIDLFTTALDTADGRRVIVPNAQIAGAVIDNQSHHPRRRAEVLLNVVSSAPTETVRQVLVTATREAIASAGGLEIPPPEVVMNDFGRASVQWAVRVWAPREKLGAVRTQLLETTKRELDAAGVRLSPR